MVLLIVLSVIVALLGLVTLNEATRGVGLIGLACYLAILAVVVSHRAREKRSSSDPTKTVAGAVKEARSWRWRPGEKDSEQDGPE